MAQKANKCAKFYENWSTGTFQEITMSVMNEQTCVITIRGVTSKKWGVPILVSFGSLWGQIDIEMLKAPRGVGCREGGGAVPLPRKFFITYSRKGAFWWIPDAF